MKRTRYLDTILGSARPGEIYAYRTLKPSRPRWTLARRHWGYVGQTRDGNRRHRQHMGVALPGDRYAAHGQPWNDLDPRRYVLWRSRSVRGWRLSLVEILFIRTLLPVYNVTHNLGNLRRITPPVAKAQRAQRDAGTWVMPAFNPAFMIRWAGLFLIIFGIVGTIVF